MDPVFDKGLLKARDLMEKAFALFRGTEAEDMFDHAAIVPAAIEEGDFATRRQMIDVALEIPLALFGFAGFRKCNNPRAARIKIFAEPLDCSALTSRIAALKDNADAGAGGFHPGLQFHKFDLQGRHFGIIELSLHPLFVRITRVQYVILVRSLDCAANSIRRFCLKIAADGAVKWQSHGESLSVICSI